MAETANCNYQDKEILGVLIQTFNVKCQMLCNTRD